MNKKADPKAQPSKAHAKRKVVLPKANKTMTVRGAWSVKDLLK